MQKSAILIRYSVQITKIFCNLNTVKDKYGGFLHERLRAFKRLCNLNAALSAAAVHEQGQNVKTKDSGVQKTTQPIFITWYTKHHCTFCCTKTFVMETCEFISNKQIMFHQATAYFVSNL